MYHLKMSLIVENVGIKGTLTSFLENSAYRQIKIPPKGGKN